ncbi:MAG: hypothetical protein JNK12_11825 [Acidimicrobiales bacterium]|nr:hypothetical protein [Acidimicrobiales bacterium]
MTSTSAPRAPYRPGDRFDAACTQFEARLEAHLAAAQRRFLTCFAVALTLQTLVLAVAILATR